jgi:hypothetical protein
MTNARDVTRSCPTGDCFEIDQDEGKQGRKGRTGIRVCRIRERELHKYFKEVVRWLCVRVTQSKVMIPELNKLECRSKGKKKEEFIMLCYNV